MKISPRQALGIVSIAGLATVVAATMVTEPSRSSIVVAQNRETNDARREPAAQVAAEIAPLEHVAVARVPDVAQREEVEDAGQAIEATPAEEGTATLRGRLVDFTTGAPIDGARLSVRVQRSGEKKLFHPETYPESGANGVFEVRGLPAGIASLATMAPERLDVWLEPFPIERDAVLDLGDIALLRGGGIRARLHGLDGEELTDVGAVIVRTRLGDRVRGLDLAQPWKRTGSDRHVEWNRLTPGRWSVTYPREPRGGGCGIGRTVPPEEPVERIDWYVMAFVDVTEGRVTQVDIGPSVFERGALAGRVTRDGVPVAGARVRIVSDPRDPASGVTLHLDRERGVDGNGAFRFERLPAGPARLTALFPAESGSTETEALIEEAVTIPAGAELRHDVDLERRATIRGRVTFRRSDSVFGSAQIRARRDGSREPSVRTSAPYDHGEYVLPGLAPGRWWITAEAHYLASRELGPFGVGAGDERIVDVVLAAGGRVLAEVRPCTRAKGGTARVEVIPADACDEEPSRIFTGKGPVFGTIHLDSLPPGRWIARAIVQGFPVAHSAPFDVAAGEYTKVTVPVSAGIPLRVVARDRDGAEVFPSAVELRGDRGRLLALADDDALRGDGGPGVVLCAPEGRGTLVVSAPGFRTTRAKIGVGAHPGPSVEVMLRR